MARTESDREDLMAEAVAMTRRVELTVRGGQTLIVTGFRPNGWLSIYLGPDRMYQFDVQGRLRRAFVNGRLFRSQQTTLAQLHRQRTDSETILLRRDLSPSELAEFRIEMLDRVAAFHERLTKREVVVVRRVPAEDGPLLDDLVTALDRVRNAAEFLSPPIPGKS